MRTNNSHYDALTERARKCQYSADCPRDRPNCRDGECITNAEYHHHHRHDESGGLMAMRRKIVERERASGKRDLQARREFNAARMCQRASDCPTGRPNCHKNRCITNREYLRIGELAREAELTKKELALIEQLAREATETPQKVPHLGLAVEKIASRTKNNPGVLDSIIEMISRAIHQVHEVYSTTVFQSSGEAITAT